MNDGRYLMMACFAGMLLGGVFFGGLWWTVRKCLSTRHPAQWLVASGLIRMGIALAGFYFVSAGQWQRLLACLVGFIIARLLVTRLIRLPVAESCGEKQGANHAA